MKKWLAIGVVCLLVGCSDDENRSVSHTLPPSEEVNVPEMDSTVEIYSTGQQMTVPIVRVDERSKWLAVPLSVVAQHPKVLIETSEGQQIEGQVVAYEEANNLALVHFRNSARAEVSEEAPMTMTKDGARRSVTEEELAALLEKAKTEPIDRQERVALAEAFASYPVIADLDNQTLAQYEKATFTYNPDALFTFTEQFHAKWVDYLRTGDAALIEDDVASDTLMQTFQAVQQAKQPVTFNELTLTSVQLADHVYVVSGTVVLTEKKDEKTATITYKLLEKDAQFFVVSMKIE